MPRSVDVDPSTKQDLIRETAAAFIELTCPLTRVRELAEGKGAVSPEYRRRAGDLGWFALLVPESLGGATKSGDGLLDAAVIARARGATLQPGGFVGTNVVAYALSREGSRGQQDSVLAALVAGEASASWIAAGPGCQWDSDTAIRAEHHGDGYVLAGSSGLVEGGDTSEWALVTAVTDEGPAQFLVSSDTAGMSTTRLEALDLTRSLCEIHLDDVELSAASVVGQFGEATDLVERQLQIACVLTVAESLGAMDRDFGMALQYAKERIAFGRPIGSFQAVKHLLADTSLTLEMSAAVELAAAEAVAKSEDDAAEVASIAKAFVGDCGIDLAQNCFQVFGGIGFTWDHDQHLYLRRLTTDAALYGDPTWHRERLCQLAGL
jgi:alkylation response protein AidB-like acyl-CoA dehydrogenase